MSVVARPVHPDRWNPTTTTRKVGVVIHDAESPDSSAQVLCDLMARPGDRANGSGGFYGASYHAVTTNDPADAPYVQVQGADHGPFAAPPVNGTWWHICLPGRASQDRDGWLDTASRAGIRGVARFIVDKAATDGFPIERCSTGDLLAGDGGYCGHVDISNAWHQSDHTDPGPAFPWDVLAADIAELLGPPTEDNEMAKAIQVPGDPAIFAATSALTAVWMHAGVDTALHELGLVELRPDGSAFACSRAALKGLELIGPLPDAGPTVATDFAKHTP